MSSCIPEGDARLLQARVPRFSGLRVSLETPEVYPAAVLQPGFRLRGPMTQESLQDRFAPENRCFGCGPANERGLRIKSIPAGDEVLCEWTPQKHHEAFENMLNGGICGALLDCHMNWTAAWHLMQANELEVPPCTVTAEFTVKLTRPTPTGGPVHMRAHVVESSRRKAVVEATLEAGGEVTARGRGVFVAVEEDHPAYHRW